MIYKRLVIGEGGLKVVTFKEFQGS